MDSEMTFHCIFWTLMKGRMVLPLNNARARQGFLSVMRALGKGGPDTSGCRQVLGIHPKETAEQEAPECSLLIANRGAQRMTNVK